MLLLYILLRSFGAEYQGTLCFKNTGGRDCISYFSRNTVHQQ